MELLIFILVIYFLITIFSKKPNKNNQSSSTQTQEYNKSISPNKLPQIKKEEIQKKRTDQYRPGQRRKKPKISPESYLDPISWNKFEVCEVCGSENRSKVVCCK